LRLHQRLHPQTFPKFSFIWGPIHCLLLQRSPKSHPDMKSHPRSFSKVLSFLGLIQCLLPQGSLIPRSHPMSPSPRFSHS
jgi:hypothetical protein